jgi:hypothetical protein
MSYRRVWTNLYAPGYLTLHNRDTEEVVLCKIDDENVGKLSKLQWCPAFAPTTKTYYVVAHEKSNRGYRIVKLHRFLLGLTDPTVHVDHINCDTLDNRRANLRIASVRMNNLNQRRNIGRFPCVRRRRRNSGSYYWSAQLQFEKKFLHLGTFRDQRSAVSAVWKKGKELFGKSSPYKKYTEIVA